MAFHWCWWPCDASKRPFSRRSYRRLASVGTTHNLLIRSDPRRVPSFGIASTDEQDSAKFGLDLRAHGYEDRSAFWAATEEAYERLEGFCSTFLDNTLETSHESAELPSSYSWYGPGVVHEVNQQFHNSSSHWFKCMARNN